MGESPRVFLSYAHNDVELAREVTDALAREGVRVWTDLQVTPGRPWAEEIDRAVRDSQAFVVLLTPNFESSRFGMAELGFVMSEQRDSGKPLVTVQVGDATPLFSVDRFAVIDGRGLSPREIADRVGHAVTRRLQSKPAAAE